jgi:RNA polymerase sigma-70 factor (ECF subfamily)
MTNGQTSEVLQHLRTSLLREAGGLSDRQLLEIFVARRDEAAFEAMVRRHGPMVMGVCGRVLRNRQDAEDAFQAAFLVLVRKAAVITSRELLAAWLYGVAYNTALKAKASAARRHRKERQAAAMVESDAETSPPERDWLPLLDRELSGLPDRYRLPIILCELQGKSHQDAARELGCPIGTLSGRLSRGRNLLAKRLARYGLGLTAGTLSAALAQQEASASVPAAVVSATVKAATAGMISAEIAALTEGVVKAMFLAKLKVVTVILGTAVVLTVAALACTALAGGQPQDKAGSIEKPPLRADDKPEKKNAKKEDKSQADGDKDFDSLQGTWNIETMGWGDDSLPKELMKGYKFVFAGNKLTWEAAIGMTRQSGGKISVADGAYPGDFKIDPSKKPMEIDIILHLKQRGATVDKTCRGIYEIEGDALKMYYYSVDTGRRPIEFSSKGDRKIGYITLTRAQDKPDKPKQPAGHAEPGQPDRPKEAVNGLTAKIVVHRKTPDQIDDLPLDLVVTNEGDQPVRLCTLCTMASTTYKFSTSFLMRPGGYNQSASPQELEKHMVTTKPGESVTIKLPTVTIMRPKGEYARTFDGKYRIDAAYFVSPEFADAHKTWQGYVTASTIIELDGVPKPTEDKNKADRIKPGDRIYIYVKPSLPDNPIRATYEVEASGKVALGPGYDRVVVADMTLEEAESEIRNALASIINDPAVSVSRTAPTPVTEGANPELERRVQQLEKEVRVLRSALDELQKKPREQ